MNRDETARVVAAVRLLWPHSNLGGNPADVISMWHSLLGDQLHQHVDAAIRELAAQGREHAPPVGVVVKTLAERTSVAPEWDEVRAEILHAIATYRQPPGIQADPHAPPPDTYWSHPLVARFMEPAGVWKEWRMSREGDGTFAAQQREAWKALAGRAQRGVALAAVGASRQPGLTRPDYLRALPSPDGAA